MVNHLSFSPCGNYLAQFNAGKLRIWDTENSILKKEFTPASHLSTECCSLTWIPVSTSPVKKKKKKRSYSDTQLSLLVLGTDAGQIFFYSLAESDVVASLSGHKRPVTALTASPGTDLYSTADSVIFQWDVTQKAIKSKWKAHGNIGCMIVSDDNTTLVTAVSSSMMCWDIESQTLLSKLDGHKSNITSLCIGVSPTDEKYIFSVAIDDRLINVWNISNTAQNRAMAALSVPDIPSCVSCNINSSGLATLSAVSKRGSLHIYSHQLNGQCAKPIKPRTTVLVTSDTSSAAKKTKIIPIMAAKVLNKNLKIVFGQSPLVKFEDIDLQTTDSELFLVRKDPRLVETKQEEIIKKVKNADASKHVEYLGPSSINNISTVSLKRDSDSMRNEVTMESMLEKMNISFKNEPSSDALAHLLIQGLNSQDRDILRSVLFTQNEKKIKSTVERLPPQAVLPLLKLVTNLVQGRTWVSQVGALWLNALLRAHVSQILADASCWTVIEPLLGLVESRLNCLGPISQLKGRLDLLLDQVTGSAPTKPVVEVQPLLVYHDTDSPADSNCFLDNSDEDDNSDGENDDDQWDDINDEGSVLGSSNGENKDSSNEGSDDDDDDDDGGSDEDEENMDTS